MTTLNSKILKVQQIFNDIADAIKVKLNIEDWEEECIGPEDYARKILEIDTCDHSDDPPIIDPVDPEIEIDIDGNIELNFDGDLEHVITVSYKNCNVINDPQILSISRNISWLWIEDVKVDETSKVYTYTIVADPNEGEERRAQIVFSAIGVDEAYYEGRCTVIQLAKEISEDPIIIPTIILDSTSVNLTGEAQDFEITVTYQNGELSRVINPEINSNWIEFKSKELVASSTYKYTCAVSENTESIRQGEITFGIEYDVDSVVHSTFTVMQNIKKVPEIQENLFIKAEPALANVGAEYTEQLMNITTNDVGYEIDTNAAWLTYRKDGDDLYLIFEENTSTESRSTDVQFTCKNDSTVYTKCHMHQNGRKLEDADIISTNQSIEYSDKGGTYGIIIVTSNTMDSGREHEMWVKSHPEWITVTINSGQLVGEKYFNRSVSITASENTGTERSGVVTFACLGESGEKTADVSVTQAAKEVVEPVDKKIVVWTTEDDRYIEDGVGLKGVTVRYENCTIDEVLDPVLSPTVDWLSFNNKSVYPSTHPSVGLNNVLIDYAFKFIHDENIKEPTNCDVSFGISNNEYLTQTYTFTHIPTTSISCTTNSLVFSDVASEKNIIVTTKNTIDSDKESEIWVENSPEWANIKLQEGQSVGESFNRNVLVSVLKNDGEERTGTITFACLGINGEKRINVSVTQRAKEVVPEEPLSIYYGYIPYDSSIEPATWKSEGFNLITEEWILDGVTNGNITKEDAGSMDKTSFGVVPKNSFLLIAVPNGEYVATMDDGDGAKIKFGSTTPNSNGEYTVTIDGIAYGLYGQYAPIDYPAESKFFYID